MMTLFKNRKAAGQYLAGKLTHYAYQPDVLVLALPRGGVPVGYEIAIALEVPLDVFIVRKLGVPGYAELAMGAIASGGASVLNQDIVQRLNIPKRAIDMIAAEELTELHRREKLYRGNREPPPIADHRIILVDDGMATGSSMRAAVRALRQFAPAEIVVAVPVAARETCERFRDEVDEMICGKTPEPFFAVGNWYEDFTQTTDEEVSALLNHAAHLRRVQRVESRKREVAHEKPTPKPDHT
ncbi:MAG: phosphoribosyltransferase [Verrucomicrobiota bacterium]